MKERLYVDVEIEAMDEEKEKEVLVPTIQEKYDMKQYFDALSGQELEEKFRYYFYNALIENSINMNALFVAFKDYNHKRRPLCQKHRLSRLSEAIDVQMMVEVVYPAVHLDINISLIICEYSYQPVIKVLAIDHSTGVIGKYFHFDMVCVYCI